MQTSSEATPTSSQSVMPPSNDLLIPWADRDWDSSEVFVDSDAYYCSIIKLIKQASKEVILSAYIFNDDVSGHRFINALAAAAQRGIKVLVLLDGVGIMANSTRLIHALTNANISFRIFHPLPWQPMAYANRLRRSSWIGDVIFCLLRINKRNHSKLVIIDRIYLACGSSNISDDHLSSEHGGKNWHDYNTIVSGPTVADIAETFTDLWHYRKPRFGRGLFRHYWNNISQSLRRQKNQLLLNNILNARKRLWIINPYFSPTRKVLEAICETANRGVDVRLIVPRKSDVVLFPLLTSSYYADLLKAGVLIYEYVPAILHAKVMLIDEKCLLGSSNLNHRSMLHDVELDIVIENAQCIEKLKHQFLADQSASEPVFKEDVKLKGTRRFAGGLIRLARYWL
ncbi:phospholipase D-like domain-containing protein [Aurantivibrio plasticivorans]